VLRVSLDRYRGTDALPDMANALAQEAATTLLSEGAAELIREASARAAAIDPRTRPS
jgi:hypothetical protein